LHGRARLCDLDQLACGGFRMPWSRFRPLSNTRPFGCHRADRGVARWPALYAQSKCTAATMLQRSAAVNGLSIARRMADGSCAERGSGSLSAAERTPLHTKPPAAGNVFPTTSKETDCAGVAGLAWSAGCSVTAFAISSTSFNDEA